MPVARLDSFALVLATVVGGDCCILLAWFMCASRNLSSGPRMTRAAPRWAFAGKAATIVLYAKTVSRDDADNASPKAGLPCERHTVGNRPHDVVPRQAHRAHAARQPTSRCLADLPIEERPKGLIGCRHPRHVAVAAAIAGGPCEGTNRCPACGFIHHSSAERLSKEFFDYRHSASRTCAAAARASGGGTAFATWRCWSKSRTRPVRRRMGPSNTCRSGKPCKRAASRGVM